MKFLFWLGLTIVGAAACAPGTDGILITDAAFEETEEIADLSGPPILVDLPKIPVLRLPAISAAGEYDVLLEERLGALNLTPIQGVEVLNVECQGGEIVYQGDESSDIFEDIDVGFGETFEFEIGEDGGAVYSRQGLTTTTSIQSFADGSGQFIEAGPTRDLSIVVEPDGSGEYYNNSIVTTTTVRAETDGSGEFYRSDLYSLLTVTLASDGSGQLYSKDDGRGETITIQAATDGTGEMYYKLGERTVTALVRTDGSWEVQDTAFGHSLSVLVHPDGSGQYRERGTGRALTLDFDTDGSSIGPDVVLPPKPHFVVTDRFPRLGTLATISPPCATVVRFDSALFFEVNKADLRPEAKDLLAEIAPALIEADRAIQVNGHTDATGTDEYNQELSQRRAQSVADELRSLGVGIDMSVQGFGESQPVAPNYNDDGSDNPVGQSQNRRVELVIGG